MESLLTRRETPFLFVPVVLVRYPNPSKAAKVGVSDIPISFTAVLSGPKMIFVILLPNPVSASKAGSPDTSNSPDTPVLLKFKVFRFGRDRPVSPVMPVSLMFSVVRAVKFETSNSPVIPVLLMFSVVSAVRLDRPLSPVMPVSVTFSVVRLVSFETSSSPVTPVPLMFSVVSAVRFEMSSSPVTPVLLMFNVVSFGRFKTASTFVRVGTPFVTLLKSTVVRFVKYSSPFKLFNFDVTFVLFGLKLDRALLNSSSVRKLSPLGFIVF